MKILIQKKTKNKIHQGPIEFFFLTEMRPNEFERADMFPIWSGPYVPKTLMLSPPKYGI